MLGQYGSKLVIEVETLPSCPYQDASALDIKMEQRCLPAKLGKEFNLSQIDEARSIITELGDFAKKAETLNELRLMKQVTDAELALVAVYEEVIANV